MKASAAAENKSKGGRPKKDPADKLEQFSIRLPPKLKLGLELLARAQHRSLSQAVEWAVQVGLHNYEVNNTSDGVETIGSLMDAVWQSERESDRAITIYRLAPALLPFEEFKTAELVERSVEQDRASTYQDVIGLPVGGVHKDNTNFPAWNEARKKLYDFRQKAFYDFVSLAWPKLRAEAEERANNGRQTQGLSLLRLLDVPVGHGMDDFVVMQALADSANGDHDFTRAAGEASTELESIRDMVANHAVE